MSNELNIFQYDEMNVIAYLSGLTALGSGYTVVMTAVPTTSTGITFQVTGTTEGDYATFELTSAETGVDYGNYLYYVTATDFTKNYTSFQDVIHIKEKKGG